MKDKLQWIRDKALKKPFHSVCCCLLVAQPALLGAMKEPSWLAVHHWRAGAAAEPRSYPSGIPADTKHGSFTNARTALFIKAYRKYLHDSISEGKHMNNSQHFCRKLHHNKYQRPTSHTITTSLSFLPPHTGEALAASQPLRLLLCHVWVMANCGRLHKHDKAASENIVIGCSD